MTIEILGAMPLEIAPLIKITVPQGEDQHASLSYLRGTLDQASVVLAASGVGKAAAAMATQILIDFYGVTHIICIGMAGSLDTSVRPGDVVIGAELLQHDVSVISNNNPMPGTPRCRDVFSADPTLAALASRAAAEIDLTPLGQSPPPRIWTGRILTGDQVIQQPEMVSALRAKYGGLCVEMEGAAAAQVCVANKIPWLVIRTISDLANKNVLQDVRQNTAVVCNNLSRVVTALLKSQANMLAAPIVAATCAATSDG